MAMEIFNGVVMRTCPGLYSGARIDSLLPNRITCESKIFTRSRRTRIVGEISAFDDKRHMDYYNCCTEERKEEEKKKKKMMKKKMTTENAGWNSVSEKKRAKLVKELAKNLNMLSELGFGMETDDDKAKTISEAALVLQTHLEHLREERKKKKVGEMAVMDDSSSSESSDSESENDEAAAYISMLRNKMAGEQMLVEKSMKSEVPETEIEQVSSKAVKEVEVCMGGKCKKAGAPVLMEEFEKVLGKGGSVVGCKCMGKCKTAPNVRVFNGEDDDDDSVRSPRNPLFLGVAVDRVPFIVANYLGSSQSDQIQADVGGDSASASYI